jgi:hypothetical protein
VDDRDKGLTHLFVRDLDEIPLPARGEWRRAPGKGSIAMRASRGLLAAGAVAAVLAVALIVGYQLNQRQQGVAAPSASPTASSSASSVPVGVPSPTTSPCVGPCGGATGPTQSAPAATGIYNDDFGFLVAAGDVPAVNVRKESGGAALATITSVAVAISPDGQQLAFFVPEINAAKLEIAPAAEPARTQILVTLKTGERGIGIAWANDSSGLLYSVAVAPPNGFGPTVTGSTLHTFDLRGTVTPDRVVFDKPQAGFVLQPIAWDRTSNVAAAGETGEGGFMSSYDVVNLATSGDPTTTRSAVPVRMIMGTVKASSDARFVAAFDLDANGFAYWPLQTMSGAGRHPPESKYGSTGFAWRPGTHELGFIGPSNQMWTCDVDKDTGQQTGTCGRTLFSGVPDGARVAFFRADGSAVVLQQSSGSGPGALSTYLLVRIGTDPKATTGDRVTFQESTALLGSVRFR